MTELLPCPFCGSDRVDYFGAPGKGYRVECKGCLAQSGWGDYGYQVKPQWNTRVAPQALAATPAQDDAVLDSYAEENQRLSDRIEELEAEVAALNRHFDAAYEAAGLSRSSSKPLAHHIMELLAATFARLVESERLIANKAREWANHYTPHSDGWNTFLDFAEWVEGLPAAQPAAPLRGREAQEKAVMIFRASALVLVACDIDMQARTCGSVRAGNILTKISDRLRYNSVALRKKADDLSAAPPEQPSNEWPEHDVSTDRLNQLVRWANDPNSTYAELSKSDTRATPEYLTGCFHKTGPDSCQSLGGCQSEACDHYNKTEYRPRMTLLAQVDGVLYPKVEK